MIAQLSHSEPFGSPSHSSSGVRSAGSFARNSGVPFLPHMSTSLKSSPAARTKTRAERLFTLGFRMLSVFSAMCLLLQLVRLLGRSVLGERRPRPPDERLDGIREMLLVDVVVAALRPDPVGLEQHVGVRVTERRLEAVRRKLDQQAERVLEVDRVHEAAVLDLRVLDAALVEALDRLLEGCPRDREGDVVNAAR